MYFKYASSEIGEAGSIAYPSHLSQNPLSLLPKLHATRERTVLQIGTLWLRLHVQKGVIRMPESEVVREMMDDVEGGDEPLSAHARVRLERRELTEENLALLRNDWRRHREERQAVQDLLKEIVELDRFLRELEWIIGGETVRMQRARAQEWSAERWTAIARGARADFAKASGYVGVV
ncbi:hypothetical protein BST61_g9942 [Cercospora zeina]